MCSILRLVFNAARESALDNNINVTVVASEREMSNKAFHYQDPFPLQNDPTEYYLLTSDYVSVSQFDGQEILKVDPQALTLLAQHAFHDASFMLRPAHQQQVADILSDPQASENDKYVALQFLRNSEIAARGILPTCQDTGTAIIMGKKGQRVWTGGGDEAALAHGVYNTYIEDNLRYSQNAALDMYKEVNTGTNLPAQIDLYSVDGDEYKFLCIAKGGGSANKTYLYQETKARTWMERGCAAQRTLNRKGSSPKRLVTASPSKAVLLFSINSRRECHWPCAS